MKNSNEKLALLGGKPVRSKTLPYGAHVVEPIDIDRVTEVLRSSFLTGGEEIGKFESTICKITTAKHGVAMSSGTAALHGMMSAVGIGPGDEVIVPAITFVASANAVQYQGGTPVFADVLESSILIDPKSVERLITPRTKAILAVDYAGMCCDYKALKVLATKYDLWLLSDSCHSLGSSLEGTPAGALADATVFSFHPVKAITTGEGGMIVTNDPKIAEQARFFRNHGITTTASEREKKGLWHYDMSMLGFNYRITDIQAALGTSQLSRLDRYVEKREDIARNYRNKLKISTLFEILQEPKMSKNANHLFVVKVRAGCETSRDKIVEMLRAEGIGATVHYRLVYEHSFYRSTLKTKPNCPVAEDVSYRIISLPIFPTMTPQDLDDVISALTKIEKHITASSGAKAVGR